LFGIQRISLQSKSKNRQKSRMTLRNLYKRVMDNSDYKPKDEADI
jgi:hypothetical protein